MIKSGGDARNAEHPFDVWIDVTAMGDRVPRRILAIDGREIEVQNAQGFYVSGRIDAAELERRIEEALSGTP